MSLDLLVRALCVKVRELMVTSHVADLQAHDMFTACGRDPFFWLTHLEAKLGRSAFPWVEQEIARLPAYISTTSYLGAFRIYAERPEKVLDKDEMREVPDEVLRLINMVPPERYIFVSN